MTTKNIHKSVREHYAAIARTTPESQPSSCCSSASSSSCCGSSTSIALEQIGVKAETASCCDRSTYAENLYGAQSLADLPVDVTGISLGCGDPVTIAGLKAGEVVLDLGSGGGIDCFLAARQVGDTGYVIGVDMTPEMLAKANTNKLKLSATNVEFRKGQIEDLPVKDNSVDVIMSNCVINLSPEKPAVFKDAFRVLKPGGRIAISDIVTEGNFTPEQRADMSAWAGCIAGAIDVNDYLGYMREVGFVDIQVVDKTDAGQKNREVATIADKPFIFSARITAIKPA